MNEVNPAQESPLEPEPDDTGSAAAGMTTVREKVATVIGSAAAGMTTVREKVATVIQKLFPAPLEETGHGPHIIVFLCGAAFVMFLVWASIGTLDIVSMTTGQVIPSTQVKTIQHLEGGIVRKILIREGSRVTAGQQLVILEPTTSSADVGELEIRLRSHRTEIAQLEALLNGAREPVFAKELMDTHPQLLRQAKENFMSRLKRHQSQLALQREAVTQRRQEIKENSARIRNGENRLKLLEEQIAISENLLKEDLTNRYLHLDLLKEASSLKGDGEVYRAAMQRANSALREAQVELENIQDIFNENNRKALDESRANFGELAQRMQKYKDSLQRTVLRSPVDGTIKSLYVFTIGGVVRSGDPIVDIVPAGDRLIIESKLPTEDIGYVETGQAATIKLASADAMRFGSLSGKVINISPDTLVTPEGMPFYKVRINTEKDHFQRGKHKYNLFPGMLVIANIHTGQRTVLEYILAPLFRSMDDALQER